MLLRKIFLFCETEDFAIGMIFWQQINFSRQFLLNNWTHKINCLGYVQEQNWVSTIINVNYYIIYIISLYKYLFMKFADQQQLWIVYLLTRAFVTGWHWAEEIMLMKS